MNSDIRSRTIPGTVMEKQKMGNVTGTAFLDKIFFITDGIMLSHIREICGIDGSTLQNWTKRGWVASAKSKRYGKDQLARILIINMMRDSMQLEKIAQVLAYVNGRAGDTADDIIPESELYGYLCTMIDRLSEANMTPDTEGAKELISRTIAPYTERTAGARRRLEKACAVIITAYFATLIRQSANAMYDELFSV